MERDLEKSCVHDYSQDYLTFVAREDNVTFTFVGITNNGVINEASYSIDDGATWTQIAGDKYTPPINTGEKIMWKGSLEPTDEGIGYFISNLKFDVQGNVMSLLYGDNFKVQTDLGRLDSLEALFSGCIKLINAKNLSLPATKLSEWCYARLFESCSSLISAPALPAIELEESCYFCMFSDCTSLASAPALSATKLADRCYESMFSGCTSLTSAPALPATTLVYSCYNSMFSGCTGLTVAPILPATELAEECYNGMFYRCTSLNYIKAMFTTNEDPGWVRDVAATGIFVKNSSATWTEIDEVVPDGWLVVPSNIIDNYLQLHWKNLINQPTYFWDDRTQTLGLNGDWIRELCAGYEFHDTVFKLIKHKLSCGVKNLYLGDCFRTDGIKLPFDINDLKNVSIILDPSNPYCMMENGVIKYIDGSLLPISTSC